MIAVGFAAAPAAAQDLGTNADFDESDYDRLLDGGDTVYQGQLALVNVSDLTAEDVELRRVDDDGNVGALVATPDVVEDNSSNDYVIIDTENRDSDLYVVTDAGRNAPADGNGTQFELVTQSVEFSFDENSVDNAGDTEVDIDVSSDIRNNYVATFTADGLDEDDLEGLFNTSDNSNVTDMYVDDGDVLRSAIYDNRTSEDAGNYILTEDAIHVFGVEGTTTLDFEDVDAGDYNFTASVLDTTAEDTSSVEVVDVGDGEASFGESIVSEQQGDITEITVEFSDAQENAYLRVGDEESVGYEANVTVFSDGADEVTIGFNTYAAGNPSLSDSLLTIESEHDDDDINPSVELHDDEQTPLGDSLLAVGQYPMELDSVSHDQIADDRGDAIGDFEIEERSVNEFNIWTASSDTFDDIEDTDDLASAIENDTVTEADSVTDGDVVIHELDASGLEGISESSDGLENGLTQLTTEGEGFDIRVQQTSDTTTPNQPRKTFNVYNNSEALTVLEGDDAYYVAFETNAFAEGLSDRNNVDRDIEDGDAFDVRFRLKDERLLNPDADDLDEADDISDFYESISTQFTYEEATGEFDEPVEVEAGEDQTLTGTTNLAAGNEFDIRVRSASGVSPRFTLTAEDVSVAADGTFTAEGLDFSDASAADEFTASVRGAAFDAEVDGLVVESTEEVATFEVSDLSPAEGTATAGDSVTVSATIENTGNAEGTQTVALTLDGNELDTTDVTLESGGSQTVEFTADTTDLDAGDYTHGVATEDGEATGTLTIE
ncbi:BGTF surface domain-containing protein, partial [Halorubrum sp. N11]|uniref:DUF7827 domain-containing protein n=1 Tax=Halorubrum sp. N11 TaxID=3402276 RepID=UPI003EBCBBA6